MHKHPPKEAEQGFTPCEAAGLGAEPHWNGGIYMLSIFICEDEPIHLAHVKKTVENYVSMENLAMAVVCATAQPNDVLTYLSRNKDVAGLYFLDLNLESDINGMELAAKIRKHDPRGFIVFITSDAESLSLTFRFKIEAMDYIVKGSQDLESRICECLQNANSRFTALATPLQDRFVFKLSKGADGVRGTFKLSKDSIVSINSTEIVYFEVSQEAKHMIVLNTESSRYEFRGSLSQIEKEMDKVRFFRCQRNLIINMEKVTAIDAVQLKLHFNNGWVVDIAANRVKKISDHMRKFRLI